MTWRRPAGHSEPHRPEPWFSERGGREPRWRGPPPDPHTDVVVGFDAEDRVVLHEIRWPGFDSRLEEVWRHRDGWSDCLLALDARHLVYENGRVVLVAGTEPEVEVWEYEGDVPVRGFIASVGEDHVAAERYVARVDEDGRLVTLRRGLEIVDWEGGDEEGLAHGLARARELLPDALVFDHRRHRTGGALRPTEELVALLVAEIEAAVVSAVAQAGVPDPFVVELGLRDHQWPPWGRVGGDSFRCDMTALSPNDGAALHLLFKASPPAGAELELAPHLSDDALRACRELNDALSHERGRDDPERLRAGEAQEQIARTLAERLNAREWAGAVDPFAALVRFAEPYADPDEVKLAREALGRDGARAFMDSVRSRRRAPPPPPEAARTDRGALAAVLAERGLKAHAHRLAHEAAQVGFKLEAGSGAGHLGGPPLLPAGETWPEGLTFLAGSTRARSTGSRTGGCSSSPTRRSGSRTARARASTSPPTRFPPRGRLCVRDRCGRCRRFEYLDGGALRFTIPREALAAGDWSRVDVEASSG